MIFIIKIIMPLLNDIHSIVVDAASANFTAHTYTEIYAGANSTPTVNGIALTMAAGSSIKIKVRSISNGTGCFLLGEKINCNAEASIING
jgi:hypothetical protein